LTGAVLDYAVTIDSVETLTSIDFFSQLPDNMEHMVESSFNVEEWEEGNGRKERKTKSQ